MSQNIILNTDGSVTSSPTLTQLECTNLGYTYKNNQCYWDIINTGATINNCIYPKDDNGVMFLYDTNIGEECTLSISFDFLLVYDCERMYTCMNDECHVIDNFNNVNLSAILGYNELGEKSEPIYEQTMIKINDFNTYIIDNTNTGLMLSGETCDTISDCVNEELGEECINMNETTLNSDWKHFNMDIIDPIILNNINGKYISLIIKNEKCTCGLNLLLDNIHINKNCKQTIINSEIINENPGFELTKIRDDKKSWINNKDKFNRVYNDLEYRETDYQIDSERLLLNTKEVDISLDASQATEFDVFNYIKENPCIITNPISGTTVSILDLLGVELNDIHTEYDLFKLINKKLINVTSRQTTSGYPTKLLIYEYYMDPTLNGCIKTSNKYSVNELNSFYNIYGSYWSDLIEQVVPSTTIWGGTYIYRNIIYNTEKFQYKNSSLLPCGPDLSLGSQNIKCEFYTTISTNTNGCTIKSNKPFKVCTTVYTSGVQLSNEFYGTISYI